MSIAVVSEDGCRRADQLSAAPPELAANLVTDNAANRRPTEGSPSATARQYGPTHCANTSADSRVSPAMRHATSRHGEGDQQNNCNSTTAF